MFRAKREVLEQYESGRTVGTLRSTWSSVKSVMFTDSVSGQLSWDPPELVYQARTLEGEVLVREVWVSQVRLFIQQVSGIISDDMYFSSPSIPISRDNSPKQEIF